MLPSEPALRPPDAAAGRPGLPTPGRWPPPALGRGPVRLDGRHFVRSGFSFLTGQGLSWLATSVLVVLLPRYLGDVNLGRLGFALALAGFASLAANLGSATYVAKAIARRPDQAADLLGTALITRLPLCVAAAVGTVALVNLAGYPATTRALVYLLCGWILIDQVRATAQAGLQGLHLMPALAAFGAVANGLYAVLGTFLLVRGLGPLPVAAAYVAGQAAGVLMTLAVLLRHVRPRLTLRGGGWRTVLAGGLPFFVWQAALVIYGQIDTVLLSLLSNDAVVGWYVAAYRFIGIPAFVPTIVITVVFPALAGASARPALFNRLAERALRTTLLLTVPMSLGIMLIADRLILVLGYPPAFLNSVTPILLLAAGFPLVSADMVIGTMLNGLDRQKQWALTGVAAAVLNPAANLVVIPLCQRQLGNGAIGAAAVTTATELFMMGAGLWLLPRRTFPASTLAWAARCLLAAAAMAAVVLPLRELPLPIPVATGAAVYVVAAIALRVVSTAELRRAALLLLPGRLSRERSPLPP